ncbi:MAG: hypothetical protein J1E03_03905 [Acetatifactor sp.]|nr:hypothetical protein [Acetatifactor sp.]
MKIERSTTLWTGCLSTAMTGLSMAAAPGPIHLFLRKCVFCLYHHIGLGIMKCKMEDSWGKWSESAFVR